MLPTREINVGIFDIAAQFKDAKYPVTLKQFPDCAAYLLSSPDMCWM
jgi:hypothetical protein